MEVLFEYKGSRRQLNVAGGESLTRVLSRELQRVGKPRAQVFTAKDDLPSSRRGEQVPDIYLLQKWSEQWECYVDVAHCNDVSDGDRLAVVAKPKPTSKFLMLCCCGGDSSYRIGKVGGSGKKNTVPKTEEIQSLEYRFRVDSEAGSMLGDSQSIAPSEPTDDLGDGEEYIRAKSGRASWKLVRNKEHEVSHGEDQEPEAIQGEDKEGEGVGGTDQEGREDVAATDMEEGDVGREGKGVEGEKGIQEEQETNNEDDVEVSIPEEEREGGENERMEVTPEQGDLPGGGEGCVAEEGSVESVALSDAPGRKVMDSPLLNPEEVIADLASENENNIPHDDGSGAGGRSHDDEAIEMTDLEGGREEEAVVSQGNGDREGLGDDRMDNDTEL